MTELDVLRRQMEKTRCSHCGEPLDLLPCCRRHETLKNEMLEALEGMFKASNEISAEFIQNRRATNWGIVNDAYLAAEKAIRDAKK